MSLSPTQLSKRLLERNGWTVAITERWNPHVRVRQDMFGFADMIGFHKSSVILVQTTSTKNMLARIKKVLANPIARRWCQEPHRMLAVHGWRKVERKWVHDDSFFSALGACRIIKGKPVDLDWTCPQDDFAQQPDCGRHDIE